MVYKALRSQRNSFISGRWLHRNRRNRPNLRRGLLTGLAVARVPARGLPCAAPRRRPSSPDGASGHAAGRASGCPAGRARLLGPAAAAGAARPVAPDRDPLPDRDRLSAVQLHRRRRQSGRLQRRSRALAVRRDQGHLHGADAPLRDAGRRAHLQPGRCHHRLDGGDVRSCAPASISPIPITACRRASCRARMR